MRNAAWCSSPTPTAWRGSTSTSRRSVRRRSWRTSSGSPRGPAHRPVRTTPVPAGSARPTAPPPSCSVSSSGDARSAADVTGALADLGIVRPMIYVTVPVLTLLGFGDESADLDGYGPIDPRTARELAAHAPSFRRILTHPETGAHLSYGRDSYRVPADLAAFLRVRDGTCRFPGCSRRAGGRHRHRPHDRLGRRRRDRAHQSRAPVSQAPSTQAPDAVASETGAARRSPLDESRRARACERARAVRDLFAGFAGHVGRAFVVADIIRCLTPTYCTAPDSVPTRARIRTRIESDSRHACTPVPIPPSTRTDRGSDHRRSRGRPHQWAHALDVPPLQSGARPARGVPRRARRANAPRNGHTDVRDGTRERADWCVAPRRDRRRPVVRVAVVHSQRSAVATAGSRSASPAPTRRGVSPIRDIARNRRRPACLRAVGGRRRPA